MSVSRRCAQFAFIVAAAASAVAQPTPLHAQGCILIRQHAPEFDPSEKYTEKGVWQFNLSFRDSTADKHYNGTVYQEQRTTNGTYVINKQRLFDLGITYGVSKRLGLTVAVPVVDSSWAVPSPIAPTPGPRYPQHGKGLGDLTLGGRYWVLDTTRTDHNFSIGLGAKLPTGDDNHTDVFPNITGLNPTSKAVDYSVQPGDGGWGILFDTQAFQKIGPVLAFGGLTYLANPKDMNNTPSIIQGLGLGANPAFSAVLYNTVPDQYMGRIGAFVHGPAKGLAFSLAGRIEGQPRYDLIGASHGFRRPGKTIYVEPGVSYSHAAVVFHASVPITVYRNREPNPYTNQPGDATFPDYVLLMGIGYRFK